MFRSTIWHALASLFLVLFVPVTSSNAQPFQENQAKLEALWSTVITTNDPNERHENGFVAYNDKLYLIGGRGLKRVQSFDPATGAWTDGAFPNFQMHHFQAVVHNDLIYVIGAYSGTCCDAEFGISNIWTYNPQTNAWVEGDEIPVDRRRGSTGAVVYNDKIYIVGGIEGGHGDPATAYNWFDEYDPATGQWKVMPDAPRARDHFHATLFNGKLYLIGGRNTSASSITGDTIEEIDVYNFATNSWSTLPSSKNIPTPRGATASILYQGKILLIGGETASQEIAHNETEAFDPISETWSTLSPLVVGRHGTQAAIVDNAVYLAAGSAQKGGSPELDSVERYEETDLQLIQRTHTIEEGWNMLGLPVNPLDNGYQSIYDDVSLLPNQEPLTWDGSEYDPFTNLTIGKAYWVKANENAPASQSQTITGTSIDALQVQLFEGWNMISGPSCDNVIILGSSTDPGGSIPEGSLYFFDNGYEAAFSDIFQRGRLNEGVGYWVFSTKGAILTLQCGSSKTQEIASTGETISQQQESLGKLTISDGAFKSRQMLFDGASQVGLSEHAYNLPPASDLGYFDARYIDHRRLIDGTEGYIRVQASEMPLRISFDEAPQDKVGQLVISFPRSADPYTTHDLQLGDSVEITDEKIAIVHIQFVEQVASEKPDAFTLHGNYPNPFNPTTRISFDLPQDAAISIQVMDMLGREVLVQQIPNVAAGSHRSLEINASELPAGTYVYRVTASLPGETFSSTGRMVLLK
ncbi:MAG: kelch repeat-containing protein [Rhodothermales bacterium]